MESGRTYCGAKQDILLNLSSDQDPESKYVDVKNKPIFPRRMPNTLEIWNQSLKQNLKFRAKINILNQGLRCLGLYKLLQISGFEFRVFEII